MPEVEISVECKFSGQNADFEYDNANTLANFISDLQEEGMAWDSNSQPKMGENDNRGITVNGQNHSWAENQGNSLASMGVESGAFITILADVLQA